MKHLMIHNVGDKVRGKMGMVEEAMNADKPCLKVERA